MLFMIKLYYLVLSLLGGMQIFVQIFVKTFQV